MIDMMTRSFSRAEILLKSELKDEPQAPTENSLIGRFEALSPQDLAELFVTASFFRSILQPLIDQDWLRQQQSERSGPETRATQMANELQALECLRDEIIAASPKQLKNYLGRATRLLQALVSFIQAAPLANFRDVSVRSMRLIDERARHQDSFPHTHLSEAMYRAFDQMDDILGIHYELDLDMTSDPEQPERLYEGAGIGVQTSYSSILLALDRAQVAQGARILDLGSGYGRVGFVLGLLRPDIRFTGIEYVEHRVKDSQMVAARAGLAHTEFLAEDLHTYALPEADVYYMYDPFSRETYGLVLEQLISYGCRFPVTIITKGRANSWVREALEEHGWLIDDTCDSGTVCLFRSIA